MPYACHATGQLAYTTATAHHLARMPEQSRRRIRRAARNVRTRADRPECCDRADRHRASCAATAAAFDDDGDRRGICHPRSRFSSQVAWSLLLPLVLIAFLPESVQFLAATRPAGMRLRPLAPRLTGELTADDARFIALDRQDEHSRPGKDSILQFFSGPRAAATILLWLLFVADAVGFFFLGRWLPVVMKRPVWAAPPR